MHEINFHVEAVLEITSVKTLFGNGTNLYIAYKN